MKVKDIMGLLEELAPRAYAEDFDNTGLLVGNANTEVEGILVSLDALENVVDEAIEKDCNLIVSFHPIIFKGLKSLTGKNYVERAVLKAIKNDISIYAIHTALDNAWKGVNHAICEKLGLKDPEILIPQKSTIHKLVTFVPVKEADTVREALFSAGAGSIGNYDHCSFNSFGKGSFKPNEDANPTIGTKEAVHFEEEVQIGVTFPKHKEKEVLQALFQSHSYEEVAYEITTLNNVNQHIGMGMIGEFEEGKSEEAFLQYIKEIFGTPCIRHSALLGKKIKRVAVLGGSGSFAIANAKSAKADAFVTADLKYHDFFSAENTILLADVGHYESEQYTKDLLVAYLTKKITNFAPALKASRIILSKVHTNPITYY